VLKAKRSSWVAGSAAPKMLNITLMRLAGHDWERSDAWHSSAPARRTDDLFAYQEVTSEVSVPGATKPHAAVAVVRALDLARGVGARNNNNNGLQRRAFATRVAARQPMSGASLPAPKAGAQNTGGKKRVLSFARWV
jgi:hypothetical protein